MSQNNGEQAEPEAPQSEADVVAYLVRNLTATRLLIDAAGDDGETRPFVLAPLERRLITPEERGALDLRAWESAGVLSVQGQEKRTLNLDWVPSTAVGLAIAFAIGAGILVANYPEADPWVWQIGGPATAVAFGLGVLGYVFLRAREGGGQLVKRSIYQTASLAITVAFGVGIPGLAVYYFGGVKEIIDQQDTSSLALLGRALQFFFIAVAVLMPALLFFLFDRLRMGTLRERFYRQIFRLDPSINTVRDVIAKYGLDIDEAYGQERQDSGGRLLSGTRWPIMVATLVFTFGWILTLLPVEGDVTVTKPADLLDLFEPQRSAMVFAFLGAYFFALNNALRRFVRGDLRPKVYASVIVRVFIVVILAWVLDLIFRDRGQEYLLTLAFVAGIFPEIALTLIREYLRHAPGNEERLPLTKLEGIDAYDRAPAGRGRDEHPGASPSRVGGPTPPDAHPGIPPDRLGGPGDPVPARRRRQSEMGLPAGAGYPLCL